MTSRSPASSQSTPNSSPAEHAWLAGQRVAVRGKLAALGVRELRDLLTHNGATLGEASDAGATIVVVAEAAWPAEGSASLTAALDEPLRSLVRSGRAELIAETAFCQRLGIVDGSRSVQKLYTPAMLASLLGVSVLSVRAWQRRGLLTPVRLVRNLPYFDFVQVTTARRLAELTAAGVSPRGILRRVAAMARRFPEIASPLGELPLVVAGKQLLLRQGDALVDVAGQFHIDFDAAVEEPFAEDSPDEGRSLSTEAFADRLPTATPEELYDVAVELEQQGQLDQAVETCRAALVAGGPTPGGCFQLAELLYRQGDLAAARERYYVAIELDEDFVEARANLGCLLAETGQTELAIAALEGALVCHAGYADVHYHLARALDDVRRTGEAEAHWRQFVELSPDSPWADEARERLGE